MGVGGVVGGGVERSRFRNIVLLRNLVLALLIFAHRPGPCGG